MSSVIYEGASCSILIDGENPGTHVNRFRYSPINEPGKKDQVPVEEVSEEMTRRQRFRAAMLSLWDRITSLTSCCCKEDVGAEPDVFNIGEFWRNSLPKVVVDRPANQANHEWMLSPIKEEEEWEVALAGGRQGPDQERDSEQPSQFLPEMVGLSPIPEEDDAAMEEWEMQPLAGGSRNADEPRDLDA